MVVQETRSTIERAFNQPRTRDVKLAGKDGSVKRLIDSGQCRLIQPTHSRFQA